MQITTRGRTATGTIWSGKIKVKPADLNALIDTALRWAGQLHLRSKKVLIEAEKDHGKVGD